MKLLLRKGAKVNSRTKVGLLKKHPLRMAVLGDGIICFDCLAEHPYMRPHGMGGKRW